MYSYISHGSKRIESHVALEISGDSSSLAREELSCNPTSATPRTPCYHPSVSKPLPDHLCRPHMQTVQVYGLSLRQIFSKFDDSNSEKGLPTNSEDGKVDTVAPRAHMHDLIPWPPS